MNLFQLQSAANYSEPMKRTIDETICLLKLTALYAVDIMFDKENAFKSQIIQYLMLL